MKQLKPEQQTLLDIIRADARRIPKFIDGKKEEHHQAFLKIQTVYEWLYDLALPDFLSEYCIEIMYLEITAELRQIKNVTLHKKVQEYLLQKMNGYMDMAIQTECFEAAANYKMYIKPVVD